jgi:TfoX/Sxy family transcriptional regulator of competence genes
MTKVAKARDGKQRKPPATIDRRFEPIVAAFSGHTDVEAGMMMASYGLKVHGKIFAMFNREQFVVKLPKERVEKLVSDGKGKQFDPGHGRLMKEWVVVGIPQKHWLDMAKEAYNFVKTGSRD